MKLKGPGIVYLICLMLLIAASGNQQYQKRSLVYLPLGDSYTIGTGINANDCWPRQLKKKLEENDLKVEIPVNPARNGYSTEDLIENELGYCKQLKPDLVTLQIGVNDWVRGAGKKDFENNLEKIIVEVKQHLSEKAHLLLVTIPDFGVTPRGKYFGSGRNISQGIEEFNAIIKRLAKEHDLRVADIYGLSKQMGNDSSLVASDGLHPSAKEYGLWKDIIGDIVLEFYESKEIKKGG